VRDNGGADKPIRGKYMQIALKPRPEKYRRVLDVVE
jgi:hypothetical protein